MNRFLRMAVLRGVEESVRLHLDRGDEVNARDEQGMTLLMLSAIRNNGRICELLLNAGAERDLLDSNGDDALAIAIKAEADIARQVLNSHLTLPTKLCELKKISENAPFEFAVTPEAVLLANTLPKQSNFLAATAEIIDSYAATLLPSGTHTKDEWEAEDHEPPEEGDPTLVEPTFAAQAAITQHIPLDTSAGWSDFEVFLPDWATPLPRDDDGDIRERVRLLLVRATREASVPSFAVEDLSRETDGSINEVGESQLRMVLNDLGAELDERLEIDFPFESHVVFVDPEETEEEEAQVDAAMAYLDDLASRRNDPIRIYLKTGLRKKLLTAEDEVSLAKTMETFIAEALDALSVWDQGLTRVRESAELIRAGIHPLRWMTLGQDDEIDDGAVQTSGADIAPDQEELRPEDSRKAAPSQSDSAIFFARVDSLHKFSTPALAVQARPQLGCRKILEELCLRRDFLIGLTRSDRHEKDECVARFNSAINGYLSAKEQMTSANLKLAISIAKKFLYTEEPIDDLIQEGNIGLMKAVDKFDWRRGFRFSTYATLWIKQSIQRHVADKCSVIRIPAHVHERTQKILRHIQVAEMRDGCTPTPQEISDTFSVPLKKVAASLQAAIGFQVASLDEVDESLAIEFTEDLAPRDPADAIASDQLRSAIDTLLLELKSKDAKVIRMRYGLGVNDAMSLDEIGQCFEVTRERIRQIESRAIRFLQNPVRMAKFIEQIHGRSDSYYAQLEAERWGPQGISAGIPLAAKKLSPKRLDTPQTFFEDDELIGDEETVDESLHVFLPTLDEVLDEARSLGIRIDEREEDGLRRVWVGLLETPDTPTQMLVPQLLQLGFEFWPKKGYLKWR